MDESYADEDKSQVTEQTKLSGRSQRKMGETSLDGPKRSELIKRKIQLLSKQGSEEGV